mmetsp:Transcript_8708/g.8548  ORF Transcript_8708/g.8548 Transcript_8708/m.8548 type:complete len:107 (+) Transcript_8708:290-610(+)
MSKRVRLLFVVLLSTNVIHTNHKTKTNTTNSSSSSNLVFVGCADDRKCKQVIGYKGFPSHTNLYYIWYTEDDDEVCLHLLVDNPFFEYPLLLIILFFLFYYYTLLV